MSTTATSLVIVAHGSRREASNDEVRQLTRRVAAALGGQYDHVSCGFLELADPDIPTAIEQGIQHGAQKIAVLPYFLSAGRHIAEDIPEILEEIRSRHPAIEICQLPYAGGLDGMVNLLLSALEAP